MRCAAVIVGFLAVALPANAAIVTGNDLIGACRASDGPDSACWSYIQGFTEGISMGTAVVRDGEDLYCPPKEGLGVEVAKDLILGYLARHPTAGPAFAASSEVAALRQAFPCPSK